MKRLNQRRVLLRKEGKALSRKAQVRTTAGAPRDTVFQIASRRGGTANLCVIRSVGGIGDVIMTTPCLEHLKWMFPNIKLTYAIDRHTTHGDVYHQLVRNAPFLDSIVDARMVDRSKFDGVVDISSVCIRYENSNTKPMNRIDIFARACGISRLHNPVPFYKVEDEERNAALKRLTPLRKLGKKIVVLHSASFDAKRTWPVKNQLELIEKAAREFPEVQFIVNDFNRVLGNKKDMANVTDVSGTTVRELAALIDMSDLFIGPDSGPMHLAGALRKQSLVLFGSIPPQARINYYLNHTAITSEPKLSCQFCWYAKCNVNYKCMSNITADHVLAKMREKL